MTPRFAVIGASGFIGKALIRQLLIQGFDCAGVFFKDRNTSAPNDACQTIHLKDRSKSSFQKALKPFDVVINLAAYGVSPEHQSLTEMAEINIGLPIAIVEAIEKNNQLFLQAGSWFSYAGKDIQSTISETDTITSHSVYGASKAAADLMIAAIAKKSLCRCASLRLFHVYGPGENPHRLTQSVIGSLRSNRPIELTSGQQTRDFVYVDDAAQAFIDAALNDIPSGIYNVGSERPVCIKDVVESIADILEKPRTLLQFGKLADREHEGRYMVSNSQRFRDITGWHAGTNITSGLTETIRSLP